MATTKRPREVAPKYFSPKTGSKKAWPKRTTKEFKHVAETVAKAKTKTLTINGDLVIAHTPHFDFVGRLEFGDLHAKVPTKDFVDAAKALETMEGATVFASYEERELAITREGKTVKIPISPPDEDCHPTGAPKPAHDPRGDFVEAFYHGGAGCLIENKEFPKLDTVFIDDWWVRSTDAVWAFEYEWPENGHAKSQEPILIHGSAYRVFRVIDLPVESFQPHELTANIVYDGGFELVCPQQQVTPLNGVHRFESTYRGRHNTAKINKEFWKKLKMFKGEEYIDIDPDGFVCNPDGTKSFEADIETKCEGAFRINPDRLLKLEKFSAEHLWSFLTVEKNGAIESFLSAYAHPYCYIIVGKLRKV